MAYGLLLIRVVFGLSLAAHGGQKLFGWFGGPGLRNIAPVFRSLRYRAPFLMALVAAASEVAGGVLFAVGLATPFAAFLMAVVMINAIATVHGAKGYWLSNGGYEYNLSILTVALGIAATGPGRFSLDALIGWDGLSGVRWGLAVAVAAAVASVLVLTVGRTPQIAVQESPGTASA
jgi:putative oxidoreductase